MFRKVTINKVLNGFVVEIGCQTLVFETAGQFAAAFMDYAASPQKVEEEWLKKYGMPTAVYAPAPLATETEGVALHRRDYDAASAAPAQAAQGRSR